VGVGAARIVSMVGCGMVAGAVAGEAGAIAVCVGRGMIATAGT
jgi:hypothetical protein